MSDRLTVLGQTLLPKRALTELAGRLARARMGWLTQAMIRAFIRRFGVDMAEADPSDPRAYPSFNAFFARPLRAGARPIAPASHVCPVDGRISQFGAIGAGQMVQAKGHWFDARTLTGGDDRYDHGQFANLYLSPRDYHRIHMPCAGRLTAMTYIPGDLWSVSPATALAIPGLFARNERLVCHFDTDRGAMALVLVGATVVGSIATVWHGAVNQPRPGEVQHWRYDLDQVVLEQGAEMGRFLLGSTVIMLFAQAGLAFNPQWQPGGAVRLGEAMANPC